MSSLSEICSSNGRFILDEYYLNIMSRRICNAYEWPSKYMTSIKDYGKWRNLLNYICHDNSKTLIHPLGTWGYHDLSLWISEWDWFIPSDRSKLFHRYCKSIWRCYHLCPNSHYRFSLEDSSIQEKPICELTRVSTQVSGHFISIQNTEIRPTSDNQHGYLVTFDAIELSGPEVNWCNTYMTSSATASHLKACLIDSTAVGVIDGSYFPIEEVGSCEWIIATPDGLECIEGGEVIPGLQSDQNSYRSELGGKLGIAAFISSINLLPGEYTLRIVCDGLSALIQVGLDRQYIRCSSKHVDMISIVTEVRL